MKFQVMVECDDKCPEWKPPRACLKPIDDPVEAIRMSMILNDRNHFSWVQAVEENESA